VCGVRDARGAAVPAGRRPEAVKVTVACGWIVTAVSAPWLSSTLLFTSTICHPFCQPPAFARRVTVLLSAMAWERAFASATYRSDAVTWARCEAMIPLNAGTATVARMAAMATDTRSSVMVNPRTPSRGVPAGLASLRMLCVFIALNPCPHHTFVGVLAPVLSMVSVGSPACAVPAFGVAVIVKVGGVAPVANVTV